MLADKKGEIFYRNSYTAALFKNLEKNTRFYKKFIEEIKLLTLQSIKNNSSLSRNLQFKNLIFNVVSNPLKNFNNDNYQVCLTLQDITSYLTEKNKDVLFYETSRTLVLNDSYKSQIRTILEQLFKSINIDNCTIMLLEENKLKVRFQYSITPSKKRGRPLELAIGQGIAGWAAEHKRALAVSDTSQNRIYVQKGKLDSKGKSILAIPIVSNNKLCGVLNLIRKVGEYFSENELKTISVLANRIGLIIENENLYKQIKQEKNLMEQVLSNTTDGILMINGKKEVIFANKTSKKMFQLNNDKPSTLKNFEEKFSQNNSIKFLKYISHTLKTKKQSSAVFENFRGHKCLEMTFNPVSIDGHRQNNVLIIQNNVTKLKNERKMVEKQVDQITALFKITSLTTENPDDFFHRILEKTTEILNSKDSGIIFFDKGKIFYFNKYLKHCSEAKIKLLVHEFSNSGRIFNNFKIQFPECKNTKINKLLGSPLTINKKIIGVLVSINKNSNYHMNDLKLISIIADRIARKIESDNLVNETDSERKKFENIINNTADGIFVSQNGKVILWNKAMKNITGFDKFEEFKKQNPESTKRRRDIVLEATQNNKNNIFKEMIIKNSDNEEQALGVNYSFLRNANNEIEYVIRMLRDVSKDKEIENRQKEFIYTATHELRTPLTAIKGYLSMILNGDAGKINSKQNVYFERAYNSTEKLTCLVEELLEVSRLDENSVSFEKREFSVDGLIHEVIFDFNQKAKDKKLKIIYNDSAKKLKFIADYEKTKQALSNLVDNSIKYTVKGNVQIFVDNKNNNKAFLNVSDTGVGIPKKDQTKVFNKFLRINNSESIRVGGTGLGLYIVKNLIEKQGGSIGVESHLNKGTNFYFTLPQVN